MAGPPNLALRQKIRQLKLNCPPNLHVTTLVGSAVILGIRARRLAASPRFLGRGHMVGEGWPPQISRLWKLKS